MTITEAAKIGMERGGEMWFRSGDFQAHFLNGNMRLCRVSGGLVLFDCFLWPLEALAARDWEEVVSE